MNQNDYYRLTKQVHSLISAEVDKADSDNNELTMEIFAKLPIMYEFFRFLRGEAFNEQHSPVDPESQKEMYAMENTLRTKIKKVFAKIDWENSKSKYFLEQYKKIFEKDYFE